jgi:methyl-accepting chemotaxis protein
MKTIKAQLSVGITLLTMLSAALGLFGLYGMGQANAGLKTVYEDRTVALAQIAQIDRALLQDELALTRALRETDPARVRAHAGVIENNLAVVKKTWALYQATYLTPQESVLAADFAAAHDTMSREGVLPALAALREGDAAGAATFQARAQARYRAVAAGLAALTALQVEVARSEYLASMHRYRLLRNAMLVIMLAGVAAAAAGGLFLVRNIYGALGGEPDYAAGIVHAIAGGDLTTRVAVGGASASLLHAMRGMQHTLARTIGEIRQASDAIGTASSEIALGNLDLSARTEQQASSLEETAASMEQLTNTVKHNADSARQANALAATAAGVAAKGGDVMAQVIATMGAIDRSSKRIVDIIGVIDGIAFQTNILALNAAVEAARAGEQGRGFAVVAGEVRNLAQRSAAAAREIKDLIGNSVEQVDIGAALVDQAGATMHAIVGSIQSVTDILGEITHASQEQATGIAQINEAIGHMDEVTQQNAALVEQAAAAAGTLDHQARHLLASVQRFTIGP